MSFLRSNPNLLRRLSGLSVTLIAFSSQSTADIEVPAPDDVTISVDLREVVEPVNRRVMGICLMYPPFSERFMEETTPIFELSSGRVWVGSQLPSAGAGMDAFRYASTADMLEVNAFNPEDHINRPAQYQSPDNNNLPDKFQPDYVAARLKMFNSTAFPGLPNGAGITGWEIWNEPQFPQNGAWPAEDFARYAMDVSRAVRRAGLSVEIGVPLHEDDLDWNRRMLSKIAAEDPSAIQFVITHPYDFSWIRTRANLGEYYARISAAETLRVAKIDPKKELVDSMGNGRWRMVASEWNIHPEGYDPPYNVSTDIVTAIHIASMFGHFWDANIDSAQFFELYRNKNGHFHLFYEDAGELHTNASGKVFQLYGTYFRGDRINTAIDSPSFQIVSHRQDIDVPVVFGQSAYDKENGRLVMVLANRHRDYEAISSVKVTNFRPNSSVFTWLTLTADEFDLTYPEIDKTEEPLPPGSDPEFNIELPPHSVSLLIIEGEIPLSEAELFDGRQQFIYDWTVGGIMDPVKNVSSPQALGQKPSAQETRFSSQVSADSTGFVNLAGLLAMSGRGHNLREGFIGTARCWLFSPVKRELQISAGFDYWGQVTVNGQSVLNVTQRRGVVMPDTHRGKITLKPGWNEVRVRTASGSTGMGFWFAVEKTGDLIETTDPSVAGKWPHQFVVSPSQAAGVNAWEQRREVPQPGSEKIELSGNNYSRRGFVAWNDIQSPQGKRLKNAEIILTPAYQKGGDDSLIKLAPVNQAWDEETLSYVRQPERGAFLSSTGKIANTKAWSFSSNDLTALVQRWIESPGTNHGVCVLSDVPGYAAFYSEDSPHNAPRLILTFE